MSQPFGTSLWLEGRVHRSVAQGVACFHSPYSMQVYAACQGRVGAAEKMDAGAAGQGVAYFHSSLFTAVYAACKGGAGAAEMMTAGATGHYLNADAADQNYLNADKTMQS